MLKPFLLATVLLGRPLLAAPADLPEQVALLGEDFIVRALAAPGLDRPVDWINREDGHYHYRYTAGDDHGSKEQVEIHRYDPAAPGRVWNRHIGDSLVESFTINADHGIRFHRETDRRHGFQVDFSPGVTIPPGVQPGAAWQVESTLVATPLDAPGKEPHRGRLVAQCRYLGAWRVRVPAGEYDAVLIEQNFEFTIGSLKASDVRHLFYARGLGVVAEVEALRASALVVVRMKEKSAKVLVRAAPDATRPASGSATPGS